MAVGSVSPVTAWCVLLVTGQILASASACNKGVFEKTINDFCLATFTHDMGGLDRGLWCSWPDIMETYEGLTNCTYQAAQRMDCYWPNHVVDHFFMQIHRTYFHDCALNGRLVRDPPVGILAPFITVPVLITLLMTALVVWRSKRTEGVL
ncbi:hypothetical protein Q5P01_005770 [Channa striata]|uniref:Receptor activity-modifying protein 1 n=1 Tax=Channa striata TaxID=64152 RepID=A0AA88T1K4_CHASR|nr:hypothetical protein Q5P01_005770 [Channa striata]